MDLRWRDHGPYPPEHRAVFSFRHFSSLKHLFLNLDEFHSGSGRVILLAIQICSSSFFPQASCHYILLVVSRMTFTV